MPFITAALGSLALTIGGTATTVIATTAAAAATAAAVAGTAKVLEDQRKGKSQAKATINQSISESEAAGARARGDPGFAPAPGSVTPALPDIVQPTPLPGPGEVSVQLGTGQERARRRRAKSGRGRQRVFGGAGLLVPEPEVRRQTLGGF